MKQRLDVALVERGLIASREKAKVVIMEGLVYVNGQKSDKAGAQVKDDDKIEVRGETLRYVSRGGKKLEKAMQVFPIILNDCICIDIGCIDWWIYRLHAAKRSQEGLLGGCGLRPAGVVLAHR